MSITFAVVTPDPTGGYTYPQRTFQRDDILTCIPYPLPLGFTTWRDPRWRDWPIGGCIILLRNGEWCHLNEALDNVENALK